MLSGRTRGKHSSHPAPWDLQEPPSKVRGSCSSAHLLLPAHAKLPGSTPAPRASTETALHAHQASP